MPVDVLFRGVSLFCARNDCVEVLIPATPEDEGNGRPHHYSRIVAWDRNGPGSTLPPAYKWCETLTDGVELTFSAGSGRPAFTLDDAVINLKQDVAGSALKRKAELYNPDITTASVILKGGTIRPTAFSRHETWQLDGQDKGKLAYELTWTVDETALDVSFDGGAHRRLSAAETIMIGNRPHRLVDDWHPHHDGKHDTPCNSGHLRDNDFWWIYRLLKRSAKPVPETVCSHTVARSARSAKSTRSARSAKSTRSTRSARSLRGAGSPTCFMSWWE
jgi:hypothetical protein